MIAKNPLLVAAALALLGFTDLAAAARPITSLRYVPGSTRLVEQMTGETFRLRDENGVVRETPTRNRTLSRYNLLGTDEGFYAEHRGTGFIFFGDTIRQGGDAVAVFDHDDPDDGGLPLRFLTDRQGEYFKLRPPGADMWGGFCHPVGVVSVGPGLYYIWRDQWVGDDAPRDAKTATYKLYRFDPRSQRSLLIAPNWAGRYDPLGICSFNIEDGRRWGIHDGDVVLIWGTKGVTRESDLYHGYVEARAFESRVRAERIHYFTGLDNAGHPRYSHDRDAAVPLLNDGHTVGEHSIAYVEELGIYVFLYNERGVSFRWSDTPWGPWRDPQVVYNVRREAGVGEFLHEPNVDDGLQGPIIASTDPSHELARHGASYAPMILERFLKVEGNNLVVFWHMSGWNPYQVFLMRSELRFQRDRQ